MDYIWQEEDLKKSWGRYIIPNTRNIKKDAYIGLTRVMKIGGDGLPALICMGDGLVVPFQSRQKLLTHINKGGAYKEGYRPLRKKEFIEMINHNWDWHEGIK